MKQEHKEALVKLANLTFAGIGRKLALCAALLVISLMYPLWVTIYVAGFICVVLWQPAAQKIRVLMTLYRLVKIHIERK